MIFTIDYHFHPHLPKNVKKAILKCEKWWRKLNAVGVNTIISTEHSYLNPKRAFILMKKAKPQDSYIFPGMEYITKEGIDIIIFSFSEKIYNFSQLKSFKLTYKETIDFILKNNLQAFITHPYALGLTSIITKLGKDKYFQYLNKIKAVEITNTSFLNIQKFIKKKFIKKIFRKKIGQIEKNIHLPREDYPEEIKFLSAGSDAHHFESVGTYATIEASPEDLYQEIITCKNPKVTELNAPLSYWLLAKTIITSLEECFKKTFYKIKSKFND